MYLTGGSWSYLIDLNNFSPNILGILTTQNEDNFVLPVVSIS